MEQNLNDKPLSNMQIARYIESLRKEMNFDDEVYGLVKSDRSKKMTCATLSVSYCRIHTCLPQP